MPCLTQSKDERLHSLQLSEKSHQIEPIPLIDLFQSFQFAVLHGDQKTPLMSSLHR